MKKTGETLSNIKPLFTDHRPLNSFNGSTSNGFNDGNVPKPLFTSDSAGKQEVLEMRKLFRRILKETPKNVLREIDSLLYHFSVGSEIWDTDSQTLSSRTQRRGQAILLHATAQAIFYDTAKPSSKNIWMAAKDCLEMVPPKREYWKKGYKWQIDQIQRRLLEIRPTVEKEIRG